MKNFEKKESNLNQLIHKLSKLNISYSQFNFDNLSIQIERDIIQHQKEELEKKNIQILREHKFLRDRITKLEQQLKDKR